MKLIIITIIVFCFSLAKGQVGINTTTPHSSAELHIESSSKGIILPVLTNAEMLAIGSPATGLIVYNSSNNAYYYYNGSIWVLIGTVGNKLIDADSDTQIQVEETSDEDIIRIDIGNNSGATHENLITISTTETVINGNYTIPNGNTLQTGAIPLIYPTVAGNKGTVLSTDGSGNLTWAEPHAGLGIANGIQTMYFSETHSTSGINNNTYYIPIIPFSSLTVDTLEVYIGAINGTPIIKFAIYDSNGNQLAVSAGSTPPSTGLFQDNLTSSITLESTNLYYFAVTDLNNTSTTILKNTTASNPFNKSDNTSTLSTPTMGSPGASSVSVWIAAH